MDLTRLKKVLAGVSVAAISLTQAGSVFAAYTDVPSGVWFEDAVNTFVDAGYLDASQTRFRGGDNANRAEFIKLVVDLNGGILSTPPAVPSFDDVATGAWYYNSMEEAGKEGWVRGDSDCYGSHPCYARPGAGINRAEAAALIVRSFGLGATGDAAQFVDNPSGQWYTDVIQTAADHCVLQGDDSTGRVRPGDNMNRAEMVVMLARVDQGLTFGVDCGTTTGGGEAMIVDSVSTSATTVEVEFNVTLDAASAEDIGNYAITGSPTIPISSAILLNPQTVELTLGANLSAGHEYTLTVSNLLAADGSVIDDAIAFIGYTSFVIGDGILELSLSAASPIGDTVPIGAVGVVALSVDLTASCDDSVTIESMTILHEGFGASSDVNGLYAAINGARVTRKRTIDAEDQTADLRFASPLVLDPCETVTVDVVIDYANTATASSEHNLVVELPSDVFGNAKEVTGNFPIRGNTFRIAAITSGTVSLTYRTVSPDEIEIGDKGAVIGKWEVSVNSTEDQTFYSMTLEQNSSASDGDFTNLAVRRTDGTILTNTVAQTVGDFVTLVFDPPFTVLEGDKVTLEVIADIVGGAGDSIIMHFEESSDLFAVGSLYGYGVNGQLYGSQISLPAETSALPDTVNIDAGEFTIGIDGPATQDYTRDDNDAVLANIEFQTGGEDIDVKDFFIAIQGTTSTGAGIFTNTATDDISELLEDVEIRNTTTGRTIDGVRLTTTNTTDGDYFSSATETFQIYRFDDFIIRGSETWEFRVDFIDNGAGAHPDSGDQFRVHICGEPTQIRSGGANISNTTGCSFSGLITSSTSYQMQIEGLSTGDKVGDVRPRGNIAGNYQRIAVATLTIAVKDIGAGDTAVENASNVNLLRFEARAGEAEDILFTKAIFESQSGSLNNGQNYALWVDTDGDGDVDTILEDGVANQTSQVTFGDLAGGGYVIPAETTVLFEVHSDISSTITGNDLQLRFDTGSTVTFLEAEELDDGSNLSGIKYNVAGGSYTFIDSATAADVIVAITESQPWSLVSQGDLYVSQSSIALRSHQLLGGQLGEPVLRMQFRAQNEAVDVTDIQLTNSGSTTAKEVDRFELYKDGESTPFALATVGGCGGDDVLTINPNDANSAVKTFCANMESQQLVVPEGAEVDVLVRPRIKTDVQGAASNTIVWVFLDKKNVSSEASGSGAIRARGSESSNNLDANDEDASAEGEVFIGTDSIAANAYIAGKKNVVVMSKITSITNASEDPNGSAIPIGLSNIGKFKFTGADHNNAKNGNNSAILSGIIFNVNATNVSLGTAAGDFRIYNEADSTATLNCTDYANSATRNEPASIASGSLLVECRGMYADALETTINPGGSTTFVLQANVTDQNNSAVGAPSTLQVSLQNFDTITRATYGNISGTTYSNIQWRDEDTTAATFTWVEYPTTVVKSTSYAG
ncbi:S-layer homology domain-containing protein [Patescibacteria group bacterium]|nr:S-layer homology domain-containing protein [Patescibacteria group bacterium]